VSESPQLIDNERTRNPARDERLSKRLAERVGVRLLARGGQRYADAVIEGLGDPSKAWMTCHECKRPYVQEWAVREMGHAMNRAIGHPQIQVQLLALIQNTLGCRDENEARSLIGLARAAEGTDEEALIEYSRDLLERNGYTVLKPEKALSLPSLPVEATEPGHEAPLPRSNGKAP
jgi:hypothetical protein